MRPALIALLSFAAVAANPALPDSSWARPRAQDWQSIEDDPELAKTPELSRILESAVFPDPRQPTRPMSYRFLDEYLFLFAPDGKPLALFDLTLDPVGTREASLGGIEIGSFAARGLYEKFKAFRKDARALLESDLTVPGREADTGTFEDRADEGAREFARIPFGEEWLRRHGREISQGRAGFAPETFTLADVHLGPSQIDALAPLMSELSGLLYGRVPEVPSVREMLAQFHMIWRAADRSFELKWIPQVDQDLAWHRLVPGWMVNYAHPWDILGYKHQLRKIGGQAFELEPVLGRFARILGVALSRLGGNLESRLNWHENRLQAALEAATRVDPALSGIPLKDPARFVELTLTLLDLNKLGPPESRDLLDGERKHRDRLKRESSARESNVSWLARNGFETEIWPDGLTATLYRMGRRKGIVDLGASPRAFKKGPRLHYYDFAPWYKVWERRELEGFFAAHHLTAPRMDFRLGVIDRDRARALDEVGEEGRPAGGFGLALGEVRAGIPGYSTGELRKIREVLFRQRGSDLEVPLEEEGRAIRKNLIRLQEILERGSGANLSDWLRYLPTSWGGSQRGGSHGSLVKLRLGTDLNTALDALRRRGAVVRSTIPQLHIVAVDSLPDELATDPSLIEYVEPNYEMRLLAPMGWARAERVKPDSDGTSLWGMRAIHAPEAWKRTTGSRDVIVAVSDTGAWEHAELVPNFWRNPGETGLDSNGKDRSRNHIDDDGNGFVDDGVGWNFETNNGNTTDFHYHGTHVSGIIGALGGNGTGVAGVAWNVSLLISKFIGSDGSGTLEGGIRSILYAAENGARVLNASWGSPEYSLALREAIAYAQERGMIVVCAAGNEAQNADSRPLYPASYDLENVISVAATSGPKHELAWFSNWGPRSVHLAAPGEEILSTWNPLQSSARPYFYYSISGTSMAAPHVSGALALLYAADPSLNWREAKQLLLKTVTPVAALAKKTIAGGVLNVGAAVAQALAEGSRVPRQNP